MSNNEGLTGKISSIQYFSTGDGDGIRTTVFMQGCNLQCAWCHNPETQPLDTVTLKYPDRTVVSGCDMSVQQLFRLIKKDKPFYDESGGGVTFSGGEPLLQADFCAEVARMCKQEGINVLFDTAGNVPFVNFEKVLPYADTFYFDVKAIQQNDCDKYRCGNAELILSNLEKLCTVANVVVRIPIIPGHNNSDESLLRFAQRISPLKPSRVDILPFHRLGTSKYKAMGKAYQFEAISPLNPSEVVRFVSIFENFGLKCTVEK